MNKKVIQYLCFSLTAFLLLHSCKKDKTIDISSVEIEAESYLFDQLLTQEEKITKEQWENAKKNHPSFTNIFSENVLGDTSQENINSLQQFQNYFDSIAVNQKVKKEFETLPEQEEFNKMQKRLVVLFEDYKPIDFTTMISGFNFKNILLEDQLAVGLELYLKDQIDYLKLGDMVNQYQVHRFQRNYIVPDAATAIVDDRFPDQGVYNTFLKRIIYEGKKLYMKEQILPTTEKEILIGLPKEKYDWCQENEKMIWQYFIREELLYSNDMVRWKSYVFDGPFSAGMPEEAPALTGNYIGWQIVKSYMENKKNTSIKDLMETDATQLFKTAKYTP